EVIVGPHQRYTRMPAFACSRSKVVGPRDFRLLFCDQALFRNSRMQSIEAPFLTRPTSTRHPWTSATSVPQIGQSPVSCSRQPYRMVFRTLSAMPQFGQIVLSVHISPPLGFQGISSRSVSESDS